MTGTSPRILVAAFSIEANSFVPSETTLADFQRQVWALGDEVNRDTAGPTNELAGAWDGLVEEGLTPSERSPRSPRQGQWWRATSST